MRWCATWNKK